MINNIKVEICCGTIDDCLVAAKYNVDRIELNSALELGGLTPSIATLRMAKKMVDLPICCMVRPRTSGFMYTDWEMVMEYSQRVDYVRVCGIMVMGPHVEDEQEIARIFSMAKQLQLQIQQKYPMVKELSMGMSNDYKLALEHGSTMIRVGSILFENV